VQFRTAATTAGLYNSSSLFGGVDTPWRYGNWTLHGSANLGLITLGGQLYQRRRSCRRAWGRPCRCRAPCSSAW
jgi:hypothetical protein